MKINNIFFLLMLVSCHLSTCLYAVGLRFGMTGAVKQKVKELDQKVREKKVEQEQPKKGTPPPLKWTYITEQIYWSSPSIGDDGTIYIGTGRQVMENVPNALYAINPDGTLKWRFPLGVDISAKGAAAIDPDGTLYWIIFDHREWTKWDIHLYAITSTGTLKWKYENMSKSGNIPFFGEWTVAISSDGIIYAPSASGLYAIDPSTGGLIWRFIGTPSITSPAVGPDGTIYINSDDGIFAINRDGTEKWRYSDPITVMGTTLTGHTFSPPAIGSDGTIYAGRGPKDPISNPDQQYLIAVSSTGVLKWKFKTAGLVVMSSPAIGPDGTIYVGTTAKGPSAKEGQCGIFFAINPDGTEKWRYDTSVDFSYSSPEDPFPMSDIYMSAAIDSNGNIYVAKEARWFYVFNPDGTIKEKYDFYNLPDAYQGGTMIASSPAIASDGTLYVGDYYYSRYYGETRGAVYAIKTGSSGLHPDSPWPKIHNNNKNTGRKQ